MNWTVTAAVEHDADRIADVHMAAFGSNALLLAQFPTPDVRTQLRDCIAKKAADDIRDPYIAVLVVHDQDKIVSFAKWSLPITASEAYVEEPWAWPDGTNFHVLREWTGKVEEAQQRILGELPSYPFQDDEAPGQTITCDDGDITEQLRFAGKARLKRKDIQHGQDTVLTHTIN
ncbi:MAG: hypothetical protein Q9205_006359 [Flavoplaca limonia]